MLSKLKGIVGGLVGVVISAGVVMANSTVTVPEISTATLTEAGTAVFAAVALAVAIGIGIRLFKKG